MIRLAIIVCCVFIAFQPVSARKRTADEFEPVCKELDSLIRLRTTVDSRLKLKAVMKRGGYLDFYFSDALSDLPWTEESSAWFRRELKARFPEKFGNYRLGRISSRGETLENLVTGTLSCDGRPDHEWYTTDNPASGQRPLVLRKGALPCNDGLAGRHIALWQSHGLYYEQSQARWEWQRPCLFQTVEDLFTQSFVLPYLVPMLENAGACVVLPRERDLQTREIIIDNDPSFRSAGPVPEVKNLRLSGTYTEKGDWKDAGTGFADAKAVYGGTDNPFSMGTARMSFCTDGRDKSAMAEARWSADFPERGEYAVYVSYRTLPNSTDAAHYTIHHLGGKTEFYVNQQMGGGTWIYLGTFEFGEGDGGCVILDNTVPSSGKHRKRSVVTADAVKIGGGYGNIARSVEGDGFSVPETSGMPRFTEASRYWLQWAGTDSTIFSQNERKDDYTDDFMSRGDWVAYMSGGSRVNPEQEGKNIPFDLAFALHSDAGVTPNDSTVGTLLIYTLKSENNRKLPTGEDRRTSREYANLVQSQIVGDIRADFDTIWNRRYLWDRGYRESRTPTCPAVLCELLSHQNFADMKLGLDPSFRFTVSRAIYKGMLKYLANRYGCDYVVQPLPVDSFSAVYAGDRIRLKWMAAKDRKEPTADPDGFILYTRIGDGAFDQGKIIKAEKTDAGAFFHDVDFEPGKLYSFRICAYNSGGRSFPSETLSAGVPARKGNRNSRTDSCILVVNNFDRVSAPAWFDYPEYAGFDNRLDSGVPYMREAAFTGTMYQNRRGLEWMDDDCPGFGASYNDYAGSVIAGNTFDYPSVHGQAILDAGYPFCSASASAFCSDSTLAGGIWSLDLVCGKQVTVKSSRTGHNDRYRVFPEEMQHALRKFTARGGNLLVSGAHIGTDIWDKVYPVDIDSAFRAESIAFAEEVLGYSYVSTYASRSGEAVTVPCCSGLPGCPAGENIVFNNRPDAALYCVEAPDGIVPSGTHGNTFLRYGDTRISAGVCSDFGTYGTVCLGFPLEVISDRGQMNRIIRGSIEFFKTISEKGSEDER